MGNNQSYGIDNDTTLTESQIKSICDCTKMSREDVIENHKSFLKDVPSGRLDKNTLKKIYKKLNPGSDASKISKFVKIAFTAYDSNQNGFIEFDEFIQAIAVSNSRNIEDKLNIAFRIYDKNNDGIIEKKEAEQILNQDSTVVQYLIVSFIKKSIFKMYNENLTQSQLDKITRRLMIKFDTDQNGVLTKDEFIQGCIKDELLREIIEAPPQ